MQNLQNTANYDYNKNRLTDTENKPAVTTGEREAGWGNTRVDGQGGHTTRYKKLQGCTIQCGENNQYFILTKCGV